MQLRKLKVKRVTELSSTKVHDLTVEDAQHYITENGVINHNTGPEYAASIILFLSKAKLKDGKEQTGIIVTAKPNKNRFAKPIPIKFHISFSKGMNPYIGLEQYISWDLCGIQRGNFITETQYKKLNDNDKAKCKKHTYSKEAKNNKVDEVTVYFQPKETARKLCVAHLNDTVNLSELYSPRVLTDDILNKMEEVIKDKFSYGVDEFDFESIKDLVEDEDAEEN